MKKFQRGIKKMLYTLPYFLDTRSSAISAMLLLVSHYQPSSTGHVIHDASWCLISELRAWIFGKGPCSTVTEINERSKEVENSSLIKLGCCRQDGSTTSSYQVILPASTATAETTDRLSLNADP